MSSILEKLENAVRHHQSGMLGEAENIYRSVVRIDPTQADAWHLLGVVNHQKGNQQEAEDCIKRAIEIESKSAAFHSNLAAVYKASNRLESAKESLEQSVLIDNTFVDAFYNLGIICQDLKQYPDAICALETALSINSSNAAAYNVLGSVYTKMKDYEKAISHYGKAIDQQPDYAEAINNLGLVHEEQKNLAEAKECFKRACRLNNIYVDPLMNLANLLRKDGETSEAEKLYRQAREIDPENINVLNNLGVALKDQGKYDDALELFEGVIVKDPDHIQAHINRSFVHRLKGNLQEGWRDFDWRFRADENSRTFSGPQWDGSSLTSKTILIHAEQGIGDQIMFASCIEEIASEAKRVFLECDPRLVPVFQRSFPQAEVIPESEQNREIPYDVQSPMGSLFQHRRSNWESFPKENKFLKLDENSVQKWRERFDALTGKLKIGISWKGGRDPEMARQRTTELNDWQPIFNIADASFINLQYGVNRAELHQIETKQGVLLHDWDDSDPLQNLDDFAAKIAALDLVISIDNSTVHFAGGLEIPCWVLLPYVPDWRWYLNREDSPWYRTVKLFRQQNAGEWTEVFAKIQKTLLENIQKFHDQPNTKVELKNEKSWIVSPEDRVWLEENISLRWHPAISTMEESRRDYPESRYRFARKYCLGKKVLDAGCGTGYGSVILSETASHVTGIDFSERAVAFALRNHDSAARTFHRLPLEHTPFENSTFDVIVSFECIEHLISPRAGLREIARLLKNDGTAIVSVPNNWGLTDHHFCDPNLEFLKTITGEFFEATEFFYNNSGNKKTCLPKGIGALNEIGPHRAECLIAVCRQPKKNVSTDRVQTLLEEMYENAFRRHREFLDACKFSYGTLTETGNAENLPDVIVGSKIELQSDSMTDGVSQVVLRFPLKIKTESTDHIQVDVPKIDLSNSVVGQIHLVMDNGEIGQSPVFRLMKR